MECNNRSMDTFDEYVSHVSGFGDSERRYPVNEEKMVPHCNDTFYYLDWGYDFTYQCLRNTSKHVSNLAINSIRKLAKKHCNSTETHRNNYISYGKCGNSANNGTVKCYKKYIKNIQPIRVANDKQKIPLICCKYYEMRQCIAYEYVNQGSSQCPRKSIDGLLSLLDTSLFDALKYLCGQYTDGSEKCDNLLIHPDVPKHDAVKMKKTYKSPISTIFDILDSLPA